MKKLFYSIAALVVAIALSACCACCNECCEEKEALTWEIEFVDDGWRPETVDVESFGSDSFKDTEHYKDVLAHPEMYSKEEVEIAEKIENEIFVDSVGFDQERGIHRTGR